jgi:hypothetical protein
MALVSCPECSKEVSSHATSCPHCGFDPSLHAHAVRQSAGGVPGCVVLVVLAVIVCGIFYVIDAAASHSMGVPSGMAPEPQVSSE